MEETRGKGHGRFHQATQLGKGAYRKGAIVLLLISYDDYSLTNGGGGGGGGALSAGLGRIASTRLCASENCIFDVGDRGWHGVGLGMTRRMVAELRNRVTALSLSLYSSSSSSPLFTPSCTFTATGSQAGFGKVSFYAKH